MMGKDMGVAAERNAGLEVKIQAADKTALIRGLFRKYAPEPKYGTKDDKRRFKGWSDIDSFDAVERCVSANKAVAKVNESIAKLTGEPEELEGPSDCPECKLTFFSATHLRYHQLFIANEKKTEDYKTIADVGSSDPPTGMLFCPWCPLLLQGPLVLIQHMKVCREKKNHPSTLRSEVCEDFLCTDCQKLFEHEGDLWRHVYVAHGLPYKCSRCPEQFTSKKQFKTHIVTCSGDESPKCSDCHQTFPRRRDLLRHVTLTPHCKLAEPYVCEKCYISLTNRKLMLTHLWKHVRTFRTRTSDSDPSSGKTSAPVENKPFDPFQVPDFFKSRPVEKPPDSRKSPEKRREADYDHLKSPDSTRQSKVEETVNGHEASELFENTVLEPIQGFDDDRGSAFGNEGTDNRESHVQPDIPRSQIGNKKIIGFILDHPYCLPYSDEVKHVKKGKQKKSPSSKKTSPSKKSESNSSSKKKGEDNVEEKSKKKSDSTLSMKSSELARKQKSSPYVEVDSTEKPLQQESKKLEIFVNKRRIKSKPKKRTIEAAVETPSAEIVAVQSTLPQEAPSTWEDGVGVMPMIQNVTSINDWNDWNALPDMPEPPSPVNKLKTKKKKKKRKEGIDENVLNFLKETGEDPSAYEFVFFDDSDDRELDADPVSAAEDETIQIEDPTPAEKPSLDNEPPLIRIEDPAPAKKSSLDNEPLSIQIDDSTPAKKPSLENEPPLIRIEDSAPAKKPSLDNGPLSIQIDDSIPVKKPSLDNEPLLIPIDGPILVDEPVSVVEPVSAVEPVSVVEPVPVVEPVRVVEPDMAVESVTVNEPVSMNQLILMDEPISVEDTPFAGQSTLVKDLRFVEEPVLLESPHLVVEPTPVEESTLPEDAVLLPIPADSNTNGNKMSSTKRTKNQKDVISNYDNIPMFLPFDHLTDVCLIDPWDANRVSNKVKVGKMIKSRKRSLLNVPNSPVIVDATKQSEPNGTTLPAIEQLKTVSGFSRQRKILQAPPGYVLLNDNSSTNQWISLSGRLPNDAVPPLQPIGAKTGDKVVNKTSGVDLGLLSLALAAEAVCDKKGDKPMLSPDIPVERFQTSRHLVPYEKTKMTYTRFLMPTPRKEQVTLFFNRNMAGPRMSFTPMLVPLPPRKPSQTPIVDLVANCKDSANRITGQENVEAEHRQAQNSYVSSSKRKIAVPEYSLVSIPSASADLRTELKTGEEKQILTGTDSAEASRKDTTLIFGNKEGEVPALGTESPASSHNDDDFPDELNESDWDFDNPVSPSYSFVDDGDDYSPVNAHSDSFMNNSSGNTSPERASTPDVPLADLKVVLTRLNDSEESNKKNSEVISCTEGDHVCPDCGRSFKTENGYKIHRGRKKGCSHSIPYSLNKYGNSPKLLPVSPGKNRALEQRKLIQAELSDLSSSLNDILPDGSPEESYKPVEDDGKASKTPQLTCECCNRTFKFSFALNVHRSKMLLKSAAAKNVAVEAEPALKEDKAASEQDALVTVSPILSPLLGGTQSQISGTDTEDIGNPAQILEQDLESSRRNKIDGESSKEGDNLKTKEEEVTSPENHPAIVDKLKPTEPPVSEPVAKEDEIPVCDDIVIDVSKVIEDAYASCKLSTAGEVEETAESVAPNPSTEKLSLIGPAESESPVYVCSYCYRKFFNEVSLKIHLTWEKKREKRKRALQEFAPKVTLDGQVELVDVREGAETSADRPQAALPSRRSVSARKSFNEATLKILASSKNKREVIHNVIKNDGHSQTTPNTKLVSESAVEPTNVYETAVELKRSSDSAVESMLVSETTTGSKVESESTVESKLISESADDLKNNCELKTVPDSAVESQKPLRLDSDHKEVLNKESAVKSESEEQFFAEISKKILIAVESELKARSPQDTVKSTEESKIAPSENAAVPAAPTDGSLETEIRANGVNEISEEAHILVRAATANPGAIKTATPKKKPSRKKLSFPKKSPLKPKAEAFKISRSGRQIKKKKRFGVDDNFGFIPKALKTSTSSNKKPLKQVEDVLTNCQDMPAASGSATLVATEVTMPVATEGAMQGTTEVITPFATENATSDATKGDVPVPTEGALSEGAAQITPPASGEPPAYGSEKVYQCSGCLEWFASKQKLGGHRRRNCKQLAPKNTSSMNYFEASRTCRTSKLLIIHRKLRINYRNCRLGNSAVAPSTPGASSIVPSEGAADELHKEERAKYSCKVCGRVFRSERSLRTHKWQRLKRGSSKTFCVPMPIKSVRTDANERGTTQPGVTPHQGNAVNRRRRRGLKFTLKKMRKDRQDVPVPSSTETGPENVSADKPSSALANDGAPQQVFACQVCAREFKSYWALKSHIGHSKGGRNPFCVRKTESFSVVEQVVLSDDDSGQNIYPCTCFRVFSSLRALRMHRLHSDHPDSPSLSAAGSKTAVETPPAEVDVKTRSLSCEMCGRKFPMASALGCHKFRAAMSGGKSCITKKQTSTEARGETADAEKAAEVSADCISREGSVEASFESAKDVSSEVSFASAKGDESAELPVGSARAEVRAEASVQVASSTMADTRNEQSLTCHLCHRSFPSVRSLKMHLIHQKRRGFCGLDTGTTVVEDTADLSSLLLENDDTNDSSVAPSLPLDETSLAFDPRTDEDSAQQFVSYKDTEDLKRDNVSESSTLQTSEGDSKSENRRSRCSKGKKMMLIKSLYQCDLCSTNYSYLKSLFRHVETAHGNGDLKCDDCGMIFHSVQGLQIHIMTKETKLFKTAFESVKPNEVADEQATSSKVEFAIPEADNRLGENNLTQAVAVATTKPLKRRRRKKKLGVFNIQEEGTGADLVAKEAGNQDVTGENSDLTPAVAAAAVKRGKRRKRKNNSDGEIAAEENSAAPISEVPTKRRKRQADPNVPEGESVMIVNVDAPKISGKSKRKPGDQNVAKETSALPSTVEAQVKTRKRRKKSEGQKAPVEEISPSVETSKSGEDKKKNSVATEDEAVLTPPADAKEKPKPEAESDGKLKLEAEAQSDEKLKTEFEAQSDEKLKPEVEAQSDEKLKPEVKAQLHEKVKPEVEAESNEKLKPQAASKEEIASPSPVNSLAKPEKRKADELESPSVLSTYEVSSPTRKRRGTKSAKTESNSEVPQSPSTPTRTLRSNAKATSVSDPKNPCSPTPTRTVTFILSFENKNVRFVSLKCYPQQPPNPIVHCSKCKQCMMKEQIRDHDCESNHFICMCQKCRLHFPYDQYSLMDSNSKRRLSCTTSSPDLDAKLQTVSSETPLTSKCPTVRLIESNKIKKCALCGEVSDSFSKLEKHLKLVHTKLLTCLKCGTCFSETRAWESHVQLDTCSFRSPMMADCGLDRPASDETCPTECAPKTGEKRFQHPCDLCKTSFDSVEKLEGHLCSQGSAGSASPRKLFRCNSCSRWFQNEFMLQAHKENDCCNE